MSLLKPATIARVFFLLLLTCLVGIGFAAEADEAGKIIEVWGIPLSYTMILSWLLVPAAYIITEYAPVPDDSQPLIPLVFGFIASTVGYHFFGIDAGVAQLQFAAALAAGNMSGLIKHAIPWVAGRIKAARGKKDPETENPSPPINNPDTPDQRIPPDV